jgi:hypothetical protein
MVLRTALTTLTRLSVRTVSRDSLYLTGRSLVPRVTTLVRFPADAKLTHSEEHGMFKFEIIDLRQHFSYKEVAQRLKLPWLEPLDVARPCPHPRVLREAFSRGWGGVRPCRRCDGTRIVPGCLDCSE